MEQSKSVLIVDDDPDIRETLRAVLEEDGYTTQCASNGEEALALLRQAVSLPGLILLDLMMPVMTGEEMLEELRVTPLLASIPVAVVSASGVRKPAGAAAFLRKPIDLDVLLRLVGQSCGPPGLGATHERS